MEGNFLSDCTMTCLIGLMWLLILLCLKMIGLKLSGKIGLLFPSFSSSFPSGMLTFYSLLTLVIFWGTYGWLWCFLKSPGTPHSKATTSSAVVLLSACACAHAASSPGAGEPRVPHRPVPAAAPSCAFWQTWNPCASGWGTVVLSCLTNGLWLAPVW